jgi:hypothetical protein
MTPKEKAIELVDKYLNTAINFPYIDSQDGNCIGAGYMTYETAKKCALIAIEESIKATAPLTSTYYLQQVKIEIERL